MKKKAEKETKVEYTLCPKCELNYMPSRQRYCDVCMSLLKSDTDPATEDEVEEKLCPICKSNFMAPDEDMCFICKKEREDKAEEEEDDSWRDFVEEEEEELEPLEISFEELAEEEEEEEEEYLADADEFEYINPDEVDLDEEFDDAFSDEDDE